MRDVETPYGSMRTSLFARSVDGFAAANLAIEQYGVTMWFNTVGDHFQLPNSDMEAWTNSNGEPDRWHRLAWSNSNRAMMCVAVRQVTVL